MHGRGRHTITGSYFPFLSFPFIAFLFSFFLSSIAENTIKGERIGSPETWDQVTVLPLNYCMFGNLVQLKMMERAIFENYAYVFHTGIIS